MLGLISLKTLRVVKVRFHVSQFLRVSFHIGLLCQIDSSENVDCTWYNLGLEGGKEQHKGSKRRTKCNHPPPKKDRHEWQSQYKLGNLLSVGWSIVKSNFDGSHKVKYKYRLGRSRVDRGCEP